MHGSIRAPALQLGQIRYGYRKIGWGCLRDQGRSNPIQIPTISIEQMLEEPATGLSGVAEHSVTELRQHQLCVVEG